MPDLLKVVISTVPTQFKGYRDALSCNLQAIDYEVKERKAASSLYRADLSRMATGC